MKKLIFLFFLFIFCVSCSQENPNDYNLKKNGDPLPEFTFETLNGEKVSISDFKGKTILINFFATWCKFCLKELPELQMQIWENFKNKGLVVLSFGVDHSAQELEKWNSSRGFTFPISSDEHRSIYELFYTKYFPRDIVVNKEGIIIYQKSGYTEKGFKELVKIIEKNLN